MLDSMIYMVIDLAIFIGVSFLIGFLFLKIVTKTARRADISKNTIRSVNGVISLVWAMLTIFGSLQILGLTSLLTSLTISGIIGFAVTLGLQDTLSNLISGAFLMRDSLLHAGDKVRVDGVRGIVVKVGLRNCWLKTIDGDIVVVSHLKFSEGPSVNYSAKERINKKMEKELKI